MFPGWFLLLQLSDLAVEPGALQRCEVGHTAAGDTHSSRLQELPRRGKMLRKGVADDQLRDEEVGPVLSGWSPAADAGDDLDGVPPGAL